MNLLENDTFVSEWRNSYRDAEMGLRHVPTLLKNILENERWRKRIVQRTGQVVEFETFIEFLTAYPLEGCGLKSLDVLKRICRGTEVESLLLAELGGDE